MWSGPRNISTALMRAFENRSDAIVVDEPLYAHYLQATGREHPGRAETLAAHDSHWQSVVNSLLAPLPNGRSVFYQKQMAHHLLPDIKRDWIWQLTNCFLIRQPREMLTSLLIHVPDATLEDTGLPQQVELYDHIARTTGQAPPVLDAREVLEQPAAMLQALCDAVLIPFDPAMLKWPAGPRNSDGAWGPFWYSEVYQTTGFGKYAPKPREVPASHTGVLRACEDLYQHLYARRLSVPNNQSQAG